MMQLVSLILIRWTVIYPLESAIQRLSNRGQIDNPTLYDPGHVQNDISDSAV